MVALKFTLNFRLLLTWLRDISTDLFHNFLVIHSILFRRRYFFPSITFVSKIFFFSSSRFVLLFFTVRLCVSFCKLSQRIYFWSWFSAASSSSFSLYYYCCCWLLLFLLMYHIYSLVQCCIFSYPLERLCCLYLSPALTATDGLSTYTTVN